MCRLIPALIGVLWAGAAHAQVTNMPQHIQDHLHEIGPVWGDIRGNIEKTLGLYTPILRGREASWIAA